MKNNQFSPEISAKIVDLASFDIPTALFDRAGRLLWSSKSWRRSGREKNGWGRALGFGWLEFIALRDLARVGTWIRSSEQYAEVIFMTEHNTMAGAWLIVFLSKKIRADGLHFFASGRLRLATPVEIETGRLSTGV